MESLTGNKAGVSHIIWGLSHMSTGNKSCFPEKILHFYIRNHITADISIANRHIITVLKEFKINLDISHLLRNGVRPEEIVILCVKIVSLIQNIGESNAKLECLFKI